MRHVDAVLLRISTTVARFFPPPVRVTEIYLTLSLACCYTPISANTKTKHHVISHFSRFFLLTLGLIKIFLEKKKRKERWSPPSIFSLFDCFATLCCPPFAFFFFPIHGSVANIFFSPASSLETVSRSSRIVERKNIASGSLEAFDH